MGKLNTTYFLILAVILLIVGCKSSDNTVKDKITRELCSVDSILFTSPTQAINKLDSINIKGNDIKNIYYYGLLNIIAQQNNFIKVRSDSTISWVYEYYKGIYYKDTTNIGAEYNYARATLYFAIIKHNIKSRDTLIYPMFKSAQAILEKQKSPNYYIAIINTYLALINSNYKDFQISEEYYKKAFNEYMQLGDLQSLARLKIDRALSQLVSRRYDLVIEYLKEIKLQGLLLNDDIKFAYYSTYAAYYATQRNYAEAVKFAKLKGELKSQVRKGIDYAKINFSVSKYYSYLNEIDSAILYGNRAIDSARTTDIVSERLYNYYRNIGDIYSKAKLYYQATNAYRKAFIYSLSSTNEFHKKRQRETEKKYSISLKKSQYELLQRERWLVMLFDVIIILVLLLLVLLLLYKNKIGKATRKNMQLKQTALEQELMQTKSMVDVVSISLGVLPSFIDKVNDLSSKIFASDPKLYEGFQEEINSAKSETRKRLLNLVNNELLLKTSPILKYLDSLSNQEKMIALLLRQNYSTKYVASVLNISQSSVRGSKVKIKAKIKELNLSDEIKNDILLGLQEHITSS